jgi:FMN-dependent NADH-azoreductase
LAIFNGSPRETKSYSTILIHNFLKGYNNYDHSDFIIHYLAGTQKNSEHIEKFPEANTIIIIFPLYTEAMLSQVKYFIESIESVVSSGKSFGLIVQSGFPEAY